MFDYIIMVARKSFRKLRKMKGGGLEGVSSLLEGVEGSEGDATADADLDTAAAEATAEATDDPTNITGPDEMPAVDPDTMTGMKGGASRKFLQKAAVPLALIAAQHGMKKSPTKKRGRKRSGKRRSKKRSKKSKKSRRSRRSKRR